MRKKLIIPLLLISVLIVTTIYFYQKIVSKNYNSLKNEANLDKIELLVFTGDLGFHDLPYYVGKDVGIFTNYNLEISLKTAKTSGEISEKIRSVDISLVPPAFISFHYLGDDIKLLMNFQNPQIGYFVSSPDREIKKIGLVAGGSLGDLIKIDNMSNADELSGYEKLLVENDEEKKEMLVSGEIDGALINSPKIAYELKGRGFLVKKYFENIQTDKTLGMYIVAYKNKIDEKKDKIEKMISALKDIRIYILENKGKTLEIIMNRYDTNKIVAEDYYNDFILSLKNIDIVPTPEDVLVFENLMKNYYDENFKKNKAEPEKLILDEFVK